MHDNFMHHVISCCERWRFDLLPFAENNRHAVQPYRRCGASDLLLPAVSLGLWLSSTSTRLSRAFVG